MQESFIRGFSRLKELKELEKYPAWQRRIAVNMALSRWRELKKVPVFSDLPTDMYEDEKDLERIDSLNPQEILKGLESLSEGYRMVISLHLLEGMSHEEIGKVLGIVASTSRSQYTRALVKLKQLLAHAESK